MKILYWTELFWPHIGGVEVLSAQFLRALQKRNYECFVVTSHSSLNLPDETTLDGIPIYRFHFRKALANRDMKELAGIKQRLLELKQKLHPDLIHINFSGPSIYFHEMTRAQYPVPTLFTLHEPPTHASGHNTLLGRSLLSAQWVTAVSQATLFQTLQLIPEIQPRASFIHNGLEMPVINPDPLIFQPPRLLCLGRLVRDKGFDLALDAFSIIIKKFPSSRLVIAGDGPAKVELEQQSANLGLTESVEFTGWVPPEKIPNLMNSSTVVMMPSRWSEPFGLVALEAAQMARPIVAARVGGLPEIIVHERTGLLVDKENAFSIAEQIIYLLLHPEFAVELGQSARRRAQEYFSIERLVNAYDSLYQKLNHSTINRVEKRK